MSRASAIRRRAGLLACALSLGCATEFVVPPAVPIPLAEAVLPAPLDRTWRASLEAFEALGLTVETVRPDQGVLVSRFRALGGNDAGHRTRGVGRFALEGDIYSEGRFRLRVTLEAAGPEQTRVRPVTWLEGRLERPGEIRHAVGSGEAPEDPPTPGWRILHPNGVLVDEFLAALSSGLAADPGARPTPEG